jgi:hypothetical protein
LLGSLDAHGEADAKSLWITRCVLKFTKATHSTSRTAKSPMQSRL